MDYILPIIKYSKLTNKVDEVVIGSISITNENFQSAIEDTEDINGIEESITILSVAGFEYPIALPLNVFLSIKNKERPVLYGDKSLYRLVDNPKTINSIINKISK